MEIIAAVLKKTSYINLSIN